LVESESNPATDPLLIWLNGGPGCSSLDGFLYEHGPFRVNVRTVTSPNGDTTTEPYLTPFQHSWSKLANTLYIEAPVGVGFSYSETGGNDYNCTDDTTANDNLIALKDFYTKFPELIDNELFITGESYGGIYVPTLAEAVLLDDDFPAKLQGIAVGNGCSGTEVGICSWGDQGSALSAKFLTSSGFLPQEVRGDM
jgi:carboxypeptidase C (cathepsin A)